MSRKLAPRTLGRGEARTGGGAGSDARRTSRRLETRGSRPRRRPHLARVCPSSRRRLYHRLGRTGRLGRLDLRRLGLVPPRPRPFRSARVMLPGAMASRAPPSEVRPEEWLVPRNLLWDAGERSSADLKTREAHARRRCATWRCKARIKSCAPVHSPAREDERARRSTPHKPLEVTSRCTPPPPPRACRVLGRPPPRDARFSQGKLHAVVARRPSVVARCSPPTTRASPRRSAPGRSSPRPCATWRRTTSSSSRRSASSPRVRRRSPARSARVAAAPSTASTSLLRRVRRVRRASPGPRTHHHPPSQHRPLLQPGVLALSRGEQPPAQGGGDE